MIAELVQRMRLSNSVFQKKGCFPGPVKEGRMWPGRLAENFCYLTRAASVSLDVFVLRSKPHPFR